MTHIYFVIRCYSIICMTNVFGKLYRMAPWPPVPMPTLFLFSSQLSSRFEIGPGVSKYQVAPYSTAVVCTRYSTAVVCTTPYVR